MYKVATRALLRHAIRRLNAGDPSLVLRLASPDAELVFPGDNSWSTMFRPARRDRRPHVTHRGIDECRAFAQRFVDEGIQFEVEDILVNGPPWHTRVALRATDFVPGDTPGEPDRYNNRVVAFLTIRWGRLTEWEDYEDTERVTKYDREQANRAAGATNIDVRATPEGRNPGVTRAPTA
ncbi:MAG: nuclear transport factor 2 family protein [Acidimicrobiales bacterium]